MIRSSKIGTQKGARGTALGRLPWLIALMLGMVVPLPAQGSTNWNQPTSPDPWGGSIQPWTGSAGASVAGPYNPGRGFGRRMSVRPGLQMNANPLWGWIGIGQPKAYGTHLPPYPVNSGRGQAQGTYPGQQQSGQGGQYSLPNYLYGKNAYKGNLLPGGPTPGVTPEKQGERTMPGIPKWLNQSGRGHRVLSKRDLGYGRDPARCFLLRMQDRVEVRPGGEEAFYRLDYWDKTRVLGPDSGIRVVGGGRALVVFPAGTQLDLARPAEIWFRKGTQERLELECRDIHTANINFGTREVRLSLPEGSRIRGRGLSLSITRERRPAPWMPGMTEDSLILKNWGPAILFLDSKVQGAKTVTIKANRRVVLPIPVFREGKPPAERKDDPPLDWSMEGGGVPLQASVQADIRVNGKGLDITSRSGTARLQWGGFAARLQQGWRLRIDPIGGSPFGSGRPVPHQRIAPKEPKK